MTAAGSRACSCGGTRARPAVLYMAGRAVSSGRRFVNERMEGDSSSTSAKPRISARVERYRWQKRSDDCPADLLMNANARSGQAPEREHRFDHDHE